MTASASGLASLVAHTLVGLLDMVKDFSAGEKVKLALDASKMYAFEVDGGLMSSPFGGGK